MDTFSMMLACGVISWVLDVAILVEPLLVVSTQSEIGRKTTKMLQV